MNFFRLPVLLALTLFLHSTIWAQPNKNLPKYRPQLTAILTAAMKRLPEGAEHDIARLHVARSLSKNGNYPEAAALIGALKEASRRATGWSFLGRDRALFGNDLPGAKAHFAAAAEAARQISSSVSDRNGALRSIAIDQARGHDVPGAMSLVEGPELKSDFRALTDVARVGARAFYLEPAEKLLKIATTPEETSQANALLAIGYSCNFDQEKARAALKEVTQPEHKIPAMLALYDDERLEQILSQTPPDKKEMAAALALVSQIEPQEFIDLSGHMRDADRGAIALRQLDWAHEKANIATALQTLAQIEDSRNAQNYYVEICGILAQENDEQALSVANDEKLDVNVRIACLCDIVRALGDRWAAANDAVAAGTGATKAAGAKEAAGAAKKAERDAINKKVSATATKAVELAGTQDDVSREWALASIARAIAQARGYKTAFELAGSLTAARRKAYAFAGIAQTAIEQDNAERAKEALDALATAAQEEPENAESVAITAQSVLGLLEPLLDDEPATLSDAAAGLS